MNIKWIVLLGAFALTACDSTRQGRQTTFEPQTTERVVTRVVREQLPPIPVPATPDLRNVEFELPRDRSLPEVIRNTTACRSVDPADQDLDFWARCGEFPVDPNSDIFVGLTQEEFNDLQYNLETLRQYIAILKERIAIANDQREASRN